MTRTSNLRRQHDAAIALVADIQKLVASPGALQTRETAFQVTMLLAKLTGLLRIHFAQEDRVLYPSLMVSGRGGVAATARRFAEEMGQLGPVYAAFAEKWTVTDALLADPDGFRRESTTVFDALANRIERENHELYPMAETRGQDDEKADAA
ncbi:MAG: hemerythrin domain-containing protein [Sphingomonas sp.]